MTPRRAVLFDFDGVILESLHIKTEAFRELFRGHPRWTERIVRYHLRHAGVSRFRKFEHIYRRFLRKPLTAAEKRRLGREFNRLVFAKVLACRFVPGARRALASLRRSASLFVVSGTPEPELRAIVRRRGLGKFFRGVYGSPPEKGALVRRALERARVSPRDALMVGDALADLAAARRNGVPFLARVPKGRRSPFPRGTRRVADLTDLPRLAAGRPR